MQKIFKGEFTTIIVDTNYILVNREYLYLSSDEFLKDWPKSINDRGIFRDAYEYEAWLEKQDNRIKIIDEILDEKIHN